MTTLLSVCVGLGLAAATGFRVFVPWRVMSVASRSGYLDLSERFAWIGSTPALIAFAAATGLEIAAYFVPWLDNLLDSVATPAAVVAGVIATASVVTGMDPFLRWTLAVIAGGGLAAVVQSATVAGRAASSAMTGGLGNPVLALLEAGGSLVVAIGAVLAAPLALVLVFVLVWVARSRLARRRAAAGGGPAP